MATTPCADPVASNRLPTEKRAAAPTHVGLSARVIAWVNEFYCGLHGHDHLMQFGKDRVYLRCVTCGHESPGWALAAVPPRIVVHGDARRQALARPRLITARRIA